MTRYLMLLPLLSLLGCPGTPEAPPVVLEPPGIEDGEVAVYDIVRRDTVLYRSRMTVHFSEEVRPVGPNLSDRVATLELTTTIATVGADEYFADSSLVVMRRDNLQPIRSWRELETEIGMFEVQATYEPGRVTIVKQAIDGSQKKDLRLRPNTFDNEMLAFVLRALPPVPSASVVFNVVVPIDMRTMAVDAKVLGTKVIETPLGAITCREVRLLVGDREMRLAYELEPPRRLVLFADPRRETELRLVEYRRAEPAGQPQ